ncbi:hypothetical protein Q1695_015174 [Nippostrongylus brasiliensis]|nr:hypothetical protein Q1695_015174 [Nippostrongylus brasiliensis]
MFTQLGHLGQIVAQPTPAAPAMATWNGTPTVAAMPVTTTQGRGGGEPRLWSWGPPPHPRLRLRRHSSSCPRGSFWANGDLVEGGQRNHGEGIGLARRRRINCSP